MGDVGGEMTTGSGHRVSPAAAARPLEDENVLGEVLVRLSPQLSSLARASLVCKPWGRLAASADFRRRWGDHHGRPPVIGVFEKRMTTLLFTPGLHAPDRIPMERFSLQVCSEGTWNTWCVLGCRQGRVLIMNLTLREFLIYDPFSGDHHRVSFPPDLSFPPDFVVDGHYANGALLSDEQSLLKLVLVACSGRAGVEARVYSFETGTWGDIISTAEPCCLTRVPVAVVGNRLYCWLTKPGDSILELNLDSQTLALITRPPRANIKTGNSRIIPGDDGAVGLALFLYPTIEMWNRNVDSHGVATWVLRKTVILDSIFDLAPSSTGAWRSLVIGYAEDANAILISVYKEMCIRVFTVQLESMQCKRLHGHFLNYLYHPFASFYAAGPSTLQILARVNNDGGAGGAQS